MSGTRSSQPVLPNILPLPCIFLLFYLACVVFQRIEIIQAIADTDEAKMVSQVPKSGECKLYRMQCDDFPISPVLQHIQSICSRKSCRWFNIHPHQIHLVEGPPIRGMFHCFLYRSSARAS